MDDEYAIGMLTPAESRPLVKDTQTEYMPDLAKAVLLECYYIYQDILTLILPMLSIVAPGICSAQSTLTS
jgi:hypothetical protein